MYKGTYDGDIAEIKFVAKFNSDKNQFKTYLSNFSKYKNLWMVRVTTRQMSQLSGKKVFTRSDCYLTSFNIKLNSLLEEYDYYLCEEILDKKNISYKKVPYSGISVKLTTSKNFQILKTGPNSFNSLFNSYELGAGASLFCMRKNELDKNRDLIEGWRTSIERMNKYFNKFTKGNQRFYLDQEVCKNIKNYSCANIKRMIKDSADLQKKIFNGVGLYDEPYTAFYFYQGSNFNKLTTIPVSVTPGAGGSKGDYTSVRKR